ncbi:MAG: DUF362 domain-containing protein [Chitinispirillaceae bacterium]|nr:DUF362 domain-containing protein [Chitinispirillaceae bacterium]
MSINRRSFIKSAAAGAAGISLAGPGVSSIIASTKQDDVVWTDGMAINPAISNLRVVCCHDPEMCKIFSSEDILELNEAVDSEKVAANMDKMAMQLAQKTTAEEAWKTIFRSGKAWNETRVAFKVNAVEEKNLPRIAVIKKIIDVLVGLGVQPANIVLYDGHGNATGTTKLPKYEVCASLTGDKALQAVISRKMEGMGGMEAVTIPGVTGSFGPKDLVSGAIDILVNIAANKGHDSNFHVGRVTLCLKNHFGTFLKSSGTAENLHSIEALVTINKIAPIIGGNPVRQQLCIVDSLYASAGGPEEWSSGRIDCMPARIIMGTFAGAVDYCCVKKVRQVVDVLKKWNHVEEEVAQFITGFGYKETDPEWVVLDPTGITTEKVNPVRPSDTFSFILTHASLRQSVIRFFLPKGNREPLRTRIFDMRGSLVRELSSPAGSNAILWDGRAAGGRPISAGNYVIDLSAGAFRAAEKMTVMH